MLNGERDKRSQPRCDNCCFSTFATGSGRAVLICRQKKGSEGSWSVCQLRDGCANFYPSRYGRPSNCSAAERFNNAARLIPLTKGRFAVVDGEDYPRLSRYIWFAKYSNKIYYAVRKKDGKCIKMHREIMKAPKHLVVDHIDHNGLNNRKINLRLCTPAENSRNLRVSAGKSSKYKGVHWRKRNKKWAAQIYHSNKSYYIGYFESEVEAARAYDKKAVELFGRFAHLNFESGIIC